MNEAIEIWMKNVFFVLIYDAHLGANQFSSFYSANSTDKYPGSEPVAAAYSMFRSNSSCLKVNPRR